MDIVEKYFDDAFSAPEGVAKARELILKLAMQGMLVSQDPSSSTVTELLKIVEEERGRLGEQSKLKRSRTFSQINASDEPHPLPSNWKWVRLGEIGNIFNGNSINSLEKQTKYLGINGLPYIATKDVGYGFDPLNYDNGIRIPVGEGKFRVAHEGAVLMCAEGGSAGKKCGITSQDICFGNKLFANELFGNIRPRFILYVYQSPVFRESFANAITGIIGGVSVVKFVEIPVPLPPLEEQDRIIVKLDQLMARCKEVELLRNQQEAMRSAVLASTIKGLLNVTDRDEYGRAKSAISDFLSAPSAIEENASELRQAFIHLAVIGKLTKRSEDRTAVSNLLEKIRSESAEPNYRDSRVGITESSELSSVIPDEWALVPLGEILVFGPTNGYSPKSVSYETSVKSLTLSATTSGVFKGEHSKFIDENIPEDSYLWLQDGDILVQRGNTIEYVGVPAIYRGEERSYIYPDLMMKLRVSTQVDSEYVLFAMSAEPSREFLRKRASGTAGTMPKINQKTLRSLPIPLPPLSEQREIVKQIHRLMSLCDRMEELVELSRSKQSELLDVVLAQL